LAGTNFTANDWSDDQDNGADYELIIDGWQYIFQEHDDKLRFIAFGKVEATKLTGHPDLHARTVPAEVLDLLVGSILRPVDGASSGYMMSGRGKSSEGIDRLHLRGERDDCVYWWKQAEKIIKELCGGKYRIEIEQ